MKFNEIAEQLDRLSLDEQLRLMEVLSRVNRRSTRKVAKVRTEAVEIEPTLEEILTGLEEDLRDAMRGERVPVSKLRAKTPPPFVSSGEEAETA